METHVEYSGSRKAFRVGNNLNFLIMEKLSLEKFNDAKLDSKQLLLSSC